MGPMGPQRLHPSSSSSSSSSSSLSPSSPPRLWPALLVLLFVLTELVHASLVAKHGSLSTHFVFPAAFLLAALFSWSCARRPSSLALLSPVLLPSSSSPSSSSSSSAAAAASPSSLVSAPFVYDHFAFILRRPLLWLLSFPVALYSIFPLPHFPDLSPPFWRYEALYIVPLPLVIFLAPLSFPHRDNLFDPLRPKLNAAFSLSSLPNVSSPLPLVFALAFLPPLVSLLLAVASVVPVLHPPFSIIFTSSISIHSSLLIILRTALLLLLLLPVKRILNSQVGPQSLLRLFALQIGILSLLLSILSQFCSSNYQSFFPSLNWSYFILASSFLCLRIILHLHLLSYLNLHAYALLYFPINLLHMSLAGVLSDQTYVTRGALELSLVYAVGTIWAIQHHRSLLSENTDSLLISPRGSQESASSFSLPLSSPYDKDQENGSSALDTSSSSLQQQQHLHHHHHHHHHHQQQQQQQSPASASPSLLHIPFLAPSSVSSSSAHLSSLFTLLITVLAISPAFLYFARISPYSPPVRTKPDLVEDYMLGLAKSPHAFPKHGPTEDYIPSLDIVISHFDEPLDIVVATIDSVKRTRFAAARDVKTIIYTKGDNNSNTIDWKQAMLQYDIDQVVYLPNLGREGATYLHHIVNNYNMSLSPVYSANEVSFTNGRLWYTPPHSSSSLSSSSPNNLPWLSHPATTPPTPDHNQLFPHLLNENINNINNNHDSVSSSSSSSSLPPSHSLPTPSTLKIMRRDENAKSWSIGFADHTMFLQSHLAWKHVSHPRLKIMMDNTGFLSLGPYIRLDCGRDTLGNGDFIRLREIFVLFREKMCPPTNQLGAYAAQHLVSRKRILANSYAKYEELWSMMTAPSEHWIHVEGEFWKYHGEPGPSNPYLGHAVERAWPLIFQCDNRVDLADKCGDKSEVNIDCQCFDDDEYDEEQQQQQQNNNNNNNNNNNAAASVPGILPRQNAVYL